MKKYQVYAGKVTGREHLHKRKNCQDSYAFDFFSINEKDYVFGIICDGCGEGNNSEVGASLLSNYLICQISFCLKTSEDLFNIPSMLFKSAKNYLQFLLNATCSQDDVIKQIEFIKNHLLCTVIGFILSFEHGLYFYYGDGKVIINEEVITIDQNNQPDYLAYHFINNKYLKNADSDVDSVRGNDNETTCHLSSCFNIYPLDVSTLQRFAICSDGFEANLADEIRGLCNPRSLQRKMNVWSEQYKHFADDATVIVVEVY